MKRSLKITWRNLTLFFGDDLQVPSSSVTRLSRSKANYGLLYCHLTLRSMQNFRSLNIVSSIWNSLKESSIPKIQNSEFKKASNNNNKNHFYNFYIGSYDISLLICLEKKSWFQQFLNKIICTFSNDSNKK